MDKLRLDNYKSKIITYGVTGKEVTCKAYLGITYCEYPVDTIQKLNIFVPAAYYRGEAINGYSQCTAPIFLPNTVGGYMPGFADEPVYNAETGKVNAVFAALEHGYVVVSGGVRGRTTGKGKAPALIVDMKAIIRFIRYNRDLMPGDVERIVTNGTSAGGALSALAGASGDSMDFEPYLAEIGAASERDDIFAASCYCPIHNLEHADAAYEWQFGGLRDYHRTKHLNTENGYIRIPEDGDMTDRQMSLSEKLKALFPAYVNSLKLTDENGESLSLNTDGEGSFLNYIKAQILNSAQRELDKKDSAKQWSDLVVKGSAVEMHPAISVQTKKALDVDWKTYVKAMTRMKPAPAFDATDLTSPENEEFGSDEFNARHFTAFSMENTEVEAQMAPQYLIKMLNPLEYISKAKTAKYWRIRHGAYDRDTSLAIPVILNLYLLKHGYNVDFFLPWGLPHSGDYDLEELFEWIDKICREGE